MHKAIMTMLLLVTLFTNFGTRKVDAVRSWESQRSFSTKKRILDRLIRLGFYSSDNKNNPSIYTQKNSSEASTKLNSSFLKWYQTNQLPDNYHHEGNPSLNPGTNSTFPPTEHNVFQDNIYNPSFYDDPNSGGLDLLIQHHSQGEMEDSLLYRRHAVSPKKRESKNRKRGKLKKRREKKEKRREKKRRRRLGRRMNEFLEMEDVYLHHIDGEDYFDCCPSNLIVVEKQVGKDRNNHAVEIRSTQQIFYERICLPEVEGMECVFPDRSLRKGVVTRCAQQFSYVQTQVRTFRSEQDWHLDYIQIRSGCSCQVSVSPRRKRQKNS